MGQNEATTLLLLALGAFLIPVVAGRISIPAAVGEILFGVLLAKHGLGWVEPTPFTGFLAQFGFAFLMFLAGMEINFGQVEKLGRNRLLVVLGAVLLVFALSASAVWWFDKPLVLVLVGGAMSLGLALVALRETGQASSPLGQLVLIAGTLGEFVTIILLTVTDLAGLHGVGAELAIGLLKLGGLFGASYLGLVLLRTLVWWYPERFARLVAQEDTAELGVRAAFALLLASIAAAVALHVEVILGAFLAGVLVAFAFREKEAIEHKLSSFGFGFLIPIFFIHVGMTFDPGGLSFDVLIGELVFLAGVGLLARVLPMLLLVFAGLSLRQALAAGLLLNAPLTLLVAIAQVGRETNLIEPHTASAIVVYALLGGVVFPTLFRFVAGQRKGQKPGAYAP